jgi:hypothetical protein
MRDTERTKLVRIEHHLVLLDHPANAGHLSDVRHRLELVLEEPILQSTKLREVVAYAAIDERVLEDPTEPRGVGAERRFGPCGQSCLRLVQVLEHP